MNALVSIVLPVYNGEHYLSQSIESVLRQTYDNIELIVVNDCSTDSTEDIILDYMYCDQRIVYIRNEENLRLPASLNVGFSRARGEYLTWTSDDNLYHHDAIETMVSYLEANRDIAMVCCDYTQIDENGKALRDIAVGINRLMYQNTVGACFLYRASVAHGIGEYDLEMFLVEDYEYWLRINLNNKIGVIHRSYYDYRVHNNSLTSKRGEDVRKALGKLHIKYLKIYDTIPIKEEELARYFDYTLNYVSNRYERIERALVFAVKHHSYRKYLMQHIRNHLHRSG